MLSWFAGKWMEQEKKYSDWGNINQKDKYGVYSLILEY